MTNMTSKAALRNTAARIGRFRASQDGAVATWFAILLVPMLGFTYGAIKFANLSEQRSSMTDSMDASALAIARQYEVLDVDPCDVATAGPGRQAGDDDEARQQIMRFGREFFKENYAEYGQLYRDADLTKRLDLEQDLTFDLSCDDITMGVVAYTDMGGVLATQFGLKSVKLDLESNVTLFQQSKIEVALVLDVTGSMGQGATYNAAYTSAPNRRIDKMVEAVQSMLDHEKVFGEKDDSDRVKFSIVPFATFVNVGANYSNTEDGKSDAVGNWMDGWSGGEPQAHYHGANFLHAYETGPITPDYPINDVPDHTPLADKYKKEAQNNPRSSQRVAVSDRKVNHFDLFRSVPGASWKGCVEARPFPLDEIAHEPGTALSELELQRAFTRPSSATSSDAATLATINAAWAALGGQPTGYDPQSVANSLFVPAFYGDQPDCDAKVTNDCMTFQSRENDLRDGDNHQDHRGSFWGMGWTIRGSGGQYYGYWEEGPIPRRLHSYDVPDPNWARNSGFIKDHTFLGRNSGVAANDKQRYRNLLFSMYQHGLNRPDMTRRWPTIPDGSTDFTEHFNGCAAPNFDYVRDVQVETAMDRFGFDHCRREVNLRRAYVGIHKPDLGLYYGKYENLAGSEWTGPVSATSYTLPNRGPNYGCPGPLLPLTNKKKDIEDTLAKLEPSGGTNTAIGMTWGWRTLTHDAPFIEAADPDSPKGRQWVKIAILLSDGDNNENTQDYRYYDAWGYGIENRVRGDGTRAGHRQAIDYKTVRMCHRMRARGIRVYTIGFAIQANSPADQMLRACAAKGGNYFLAENAADLNKAFDEIADQITELHVSG